MSSQQIKNMSRSGGGGLKNVAGGPNVHTINSINEQAKNASAGNNYVILDGAEQARNEFPYVPFARDDYDDVANIKRQFVQGGAEAVVTLDKDDANYALRQRAQVENADFDRWVMQKYDLTDPAQNFMFQQIAPEQFQRRLDLIEAQQTLVSKYARMRLMGAKSLEDLKFEWLVETGRIELPKGPIWNPSAWMSEQLGYGGNNLNERRGANLRRFQAGLFNPINYLTEGHTGHKASVNRSDIHGSDDNTDFQIYQGSSGPSAYQEWGHNPIYGADIMKGINYNRYAPGVTTGNGGVITDIDAVDRRTLYSYDIFRRGGGLGRTVDEGDWQAATNVREEAKRQADLKAAEAEARRRGAAPRPE